MPGRPGAVPYAARRRPVGGQPFRPSRNPAVLLECPIRFITRLLVGIYFVEAGLLLAAAPWTVWWRRNYFAALHPWVSNAMATGTVQTLVVTAGVLTVIAGMADLRVALTRRLSPPSSSGRPASDA
jgi:hypothetical protein